MDKLKLVCKILVHDSLGDPDLGPKFHAILNKKNNHGSALLLHLLERFAHSRSVEMRLVEDQSYDECWALRFLLRGTCVSRMWFNLRRFNCEGTEWGLWTDQSTEFTDDARGFLAQATGIEVGT